MDIRISIWRSDSYVAARRLATGENIPQDVEVAVPVGALSESARKLLLSVGDGRYPEHLPYILHDDGAVNCFAGNRHHITHDAELEAIDAAVVDGLLLAAAAALESRRNEVARKEEERKAKGAAEREAKELAVRAAVDAWISDPSRRMDHSYRVYYPGGESVFDSSPHFARLDAEVRRRNEADATAVAEREAAQATARRAQLDAWVAEHGSAEQRARAADGLLADGEVVEAIRAEALAPLAEFPTYMRLIRADVHDPRECDGNVDYAAEDAIRATREQYATLVRIRETIRTAHPTADVTLRRHVGKCSECDNEAERFGVRVHVLIGTVHATAEYAV